MNRAREERFRRIVSGRHRGAAPTIARALLTAAEVPYRAITAARNALYARGILPVARVDCPVVCVGNLTTGGTGKTPVTCWLAQHLRAVGRRPAVLTRGYKSEPGTPPDEARLLRKLLGESIPVHVDPDRIAGAKAIRRDHPQVDVIVLDDGFQHRRLHRDFDLVLLDATNPFGFDHLLPRGTLRESERGLSRAHAVLVTHVEAAAEDDLMRIESRVRCANPGAPVYRARHEPQAATIAGRRTFVFTGIGNPGAFEAAIARVATVVGTGRHDDHHPYSIDDVRALRSEASRAGADVLATTAKDWVKLESLDLAGGIPVVPIELALQFEREDEQRLLEQVMGVL